MPVSDSCLVLHRFPVGEDNLLARCYFKNFGKRDLFIPDYTERFKTGIFEPFNEVELYFAQSGEQLKAVDTLKGVYHSKVVCRNFNRYLFVSRTFRVVYLFINEPEREVYNLLLTALGITDFFNFNLVRFLLSLSTVLGFSVERLDRPGWVNLMHLAPCGEEEIKSGLCTYIGPEEFLTLKRVANPSTRPYGVKEKVAKNLERFFHRFFEFRRGQF